ncbi:hypothetical protein SFRURICE_006693 [Spodoptera frugiperda]|nr:hypothetical protein SFRURICE_006693 [Spodoptera frugiperda]
MQESQNIMNKSPDRHQCMHFTPKQRRKLAECSGRRSKKQRLTTKHQLIQDKVSLLEVEDYIQLTYLE